MAKVGFWLKGASGKLAGASMGRGKDGSTVIREIKTPSNPKTAAQALQRMKLGPAQKFYKAFAELLSNAFQGKAYGDESRSYFLSKCMTADGPYIQKGVDRFIPAAYLFSEGSLPSIGVQPFSGGANVITLSIQTEAATVTNELLAQLLQVTTAYQITLVVVNNVNGIFTPSYIGYNDRLTIADIPEGALSKDTNGYVTINPAAFGLDMSAMVACAIVLSTQDASGQWLRSTQEMVISEELRASLYGPDAMEAAIYSYQDSTSVNSINSQWYYNLGMSQAWPGKLTMAQVQYYNEETESYDITQTIIGIQQLDGRIVRTVFATATTDDGLVVIYDDSIGRLTTKEGFTVAAFRESNAGYSIELWSDRYAAQLGQYQGIQINDDPSEVYPVKVYYVTNLDNGNIDYYKPMPVLLMSDGTTRIPVMKLVDVTLTAPKSSSTQHFDEVLAGITVRNGNMEFGQLVNGDFRIHCGTPDDGLVGYLVLNESGDNQVWYNNNFSLENTYIVGTCDMKGATIAETYVDDLGVDPTFPTQVFKFVAGIYEPPVALKDMTSLYISCPDPTVEAINSIRLLTAGVPIVINGSSDELYQGSTEVGTALLGSSDCIYTVTSESTIEVTGVTVIE